MNALDLFIDMFSPQIAQNQESNEPLSNRGGKQELKKK